MYINQRIPPKRHPCFFAHYLPTVPTYLPTLLRHHKVYRYLRQYILFSALLSYALTSRCRFTWTLPFLLPSQPGSLPHVILHGMPLFFDHLSQRLLYTSSSRPFSPRFCKDISFFHTSFSFFSPRNEIKVWETSGGWCVTCRGCFVCLYVCRYLSILSAEKNHL